MLLSPSFFLFFILFFSTLLHLLFLPPFISASFFDPIIFTSSPPPWYLSPLDLFLFLPPSSSSCSPLILFPSFILNLSFHLPSTSFFPPSTLPPTSLLLPFMNSSPNSSSPGLLVFPECFSHSSPWIPMNAAGGLKNWDPTNHLYQSALPSFPCWYVTGRGFGFPLSISSIDYGCI